MSQEEWIEKHSGKAPPLPEEVLMRALAQFGIKIKK